MMSLYNKWKCILVFLVYVLICLVCRDRKLILKLASIRSSRPLFLFAQVKRQKICFAFVPSRSWINSPSNCFSFLLFNTEPELTNWQEIWWKVLIYLIQSLNTLICFILSRKRNSIPPNYFSNICKHIIYIHYVLMQINGILVLFCSINYNTLKGIDILLDKIFIPLTR